MGRGGLPSHLFSFTSVLESLCLVAQKDHNIIIDGDDPAYDDSGWEDVDFADEAEARLFDQVKFTLNKGDESSKFGNERGKNKRTSVRTSSSRTLQYRERAKGQQPATSCRFCGNRYAK